METLFHIIDAMLMTAFSATVSEHLLLRIFHIGFMFAMVVLTVSALRLCVQFIIKKQENDNH